jgi:hypothetical protein
MQHDACGKPIGVLAVPLGPTRDLAVRLFRLLGGQFGSMYLDCSNTMRSWYRQRRLILLLQTSRRQLAAEAAIALTIEIKPGLRFLHRPFVHGIYVTLFLLIDACRWRTGARSRRPTRWPRWCTRSSSPTAAHAAELTPAEHVATRSETVGQCRNVRRRR